MRLYGGVSYKGRPYAGVGTSVRVSGRRGHVPTPVSHGRCIGSLLFSIRGCGVCKGCQAITAAKELPAVVWPATEEAARKFMMWSFAVLGVFLVSVAALILAAR